MSYILISPVKDEQDYISSVIKSVINQTVKPKLWVIVDDGSTDRTPIIIQKYTYLYKWIKSIHLAEHPRARGLRYAQVCRIGFNYVIKLCRENRIVYDYIGLLDGDTILERKYFEKLMMKFQQRLGLGIASGGMYYETNYRLNWEKTDDNLARGTGRLWTKQCFIDTGGYELDPAMHTLSNVKAIIHGYEIKQYKNVKAIHKRKTSSAEGFISRYLNAGKLAYYLDKHPLLILLNALSFMIQFPFYIGVVYLIGYFSSFLKGENQIKDRDIRYYFKNTRIREILKKNIKSI